MHSGCPCWLCSLGKKPVSTRGYSGQCHKHVYLAIQNSSTVTVKGSGVLVQISGEAMGLNLTEARSAWVGGWRWLCVRSQTPGGQRPIHSQGMASEAPGAVLF